MDPRMASRRRTVQERHARRRLGRLLWFLVMVTTAAAGWWVFRSPLLDVDEIVVEGAVRAGVLDAAGRAGVAEGVPLVDVTPAEVERVLKEDPWVETATVVRDWPGSVTISVTERVPAAMALLADGWVVAAADGVALESADAPDPAMAVVERPDTAAAALAEDRLAVGALEFAGALSPERAVGAVIRFDAEGIVAVVGGFQVRVGGPEDGAEKASALEAVLAQGPPEGSVITVVAPSRPAVLPPGAGVGEDGEEITETTNP
jgi:cell division protein FtsQ